MGIKKGPLGEKPERYLCAMKPPVALDLVSSFLFQAVKASTQMRFNKSEVTCLAAQPSHKFEKEGVLFIREKQEGFFRKTESKLDCQSLETGTSASTAFRYYVFNLSVVHLPNKCNFRRKRASFLSLPVNMVSPNS